MAISINDKYKEVILEALDDFQYKVSLELNEMKGKSLSKRRKELTKKQKLIEELRSQLNSDSLNR